MTTTTGRTHGLLGLAVSVLLVAGVVVGCSSGDTGGSSGSTNPSAAPALTGAPDPGSVPAPIWQANLSGPNPLANFRDTPYNNDGAPPPEIVDAPDVSGAKAVRYTVPGGGKRTELEPQIPPYREGGDGYFGFAWFLPSDFPVNADGWQVVAQWKNEGEGSPPIEVKVDHGQFVLDGGAGGDDPGKNYFSVPIGPAVPGQQTDVVLHVHFSTDSSKALVDVWMNGQKRVEGYRPPGGTRYSSDDSYLKTGIYRDTAINQSAVLYLIDARVADNYDSAAALVGPKS